MTFLIMISPSTGMLISSVHAQESPDSGFPNDGGLPNLPGDNGGFPNDGGLPIFPNNCDHDIQSCPSPTPFPNFPNQACNVLGNLGSEAACLPFGSTCGIFLELVLMMYVVKLLLVHHFQVYLIKPVMLWEE